MKKSFLILQGPASSFFAKLGAELLGSGHRVLHINFNNGDKLFSHGEHVAEYKFGVAEFPEYINNISRLRKITDLVIYDDSTPINKAAIEALKNQKIRIHVFGEGIFGNNWVTLEERIFGDKTLLPKDPRFYLRSKSAYIRPAKMTFDTMAKKVYELRYNFARKAERKNGFENKIPQHKLKIDKRIAKLDYFLGDYEMSKKASLIRSFAKNADGSSYLVFATNGSVNAAQFTKTADIAFKYGVPDRVVVLEKANVVKLMSKARAYITNSSLDGLLAIKKGTPVMARTNAIYNLEGLTYQKPLDSLWQGATPPDSEIFRKFRAYVIAKTQVNGSFYSPKGMKMLVKESARRILGKENVDSSFGIQDSVS